MHHIERIQFQAIDPVVVEALIFQGTTTPLIFVYLQVLLCRIPIVSFSIPLIEFTR